VITYYEYFGHDGKASTAFSYNLPLLTSGKTAQGAAARRRNYHDSL